MLKSCRAVDKLVAAEIDAGVEVNRIVVAGFSQGGVISLLYGLTTERKLGGIIMMSGYTVLHDKLKSVREPFASLSYLTLTAGRTIHQMTSPNAVNLPFFLGHGGGDPIVLCGLGEHASEVLTSQLGIPKASKESPVGVQWTKYPALQHSVSEQEIEDMAGWLERVIPAEG